MTEESVAMHKETRPHPSRNSLGNGSLPGDYISSSPSFPFLLRDQPDVLQALPITSPKFHTEFWAGQEELKDEALSPTHSLDWSNLDRPESIEVRSYREAVENQEAELCEQYFRERDSRPEVQNCMEQYGTELGFIIIFSIITSIIFNTFIASLSILDAP
jgi:hypothetical protein